MIIFGGALEGALIGAAVGGAVGLIVALVKPAANQRQTMRKVQCSRQRTPAETWAANRRHLRRKRAADQTLNIRR